MTIAEKDSQYNNQEFRSGGGQVAMIAEGYISAMATLSSGGRCLRSRGAGAGGCRRGGARAARRVR